MPELVCGSDPATAPVKRTSRVLDPHIVLQAAPQAAGLKVKYAAVQKGEGYLIRQSGAKFGNVNTE